MNEKLQNVQTWATIVRSGVEVGLVLALAFMCSQVFWRTVNADQFLVDRPYASVSGTYVSGEAPKTFANFAILTSHNPFSFSEQENTKADMQVLNAPETSLSLKLKGIRAKGDGLGVAFIVLPDNRQVRAEIDSEILDDVIVKYVFHDRVNLLTHGQLETLYLRAPEATQTGLPVVAEKSESLPETLEAGEVSAQQFLQDVSFAIVRKNGVRAGYRLTPKTNVTALTSAGFQAGDIIRKVNKRPVSDINGEDLQELLLASNAVDFDIERDGNPKRLLVRFGRG